MGHTHAVVIGGSLAGMCAARVLSDFFDKVTVVERDAYPEGVDDRADVPQGRGIHNLLIRGRREYELHFPGFERLMLERGAHEAEFGVDVAMLTPLGWIPPRSKYTMPLLVGSRALIETTVRDLFRKLPKIEVIERAEVVALKATRSGDLRCTGVKVHPRAGGSGFEIDADLIVDAAGRTSHAAEWLKGIGVAPPRETVIDPIGGYACRWLKLRPGAQWPSDWWWNVGAWLMNDPLRPTALHRYENGRWMLMLAGLNGKYPPHKEEDFISAPARFCSPIIAQMLSLMEPVSSVHGHRGLINRWRHYERWDSALRGFIATADSACVFNPIFAQGMTVAAVSASILRRILEDGGPANLRLESRFFAGQARLQREAWRLTASTDVALPTQGANLCSLRLFNWYRQAVNLATRDPAVRTTLADVQNMLRPCSALFAPRVLLRAAAARSVVTLARLAGRSLIPPATPMPPPRTA